MLEINSQVPSVFNLTVCLVDGLIFHEEIKHKAYCHLPETDTGEWLIDWKDSWKNGSSSSSMLSCCTYVQEHGSKCSFNWRAHSMTFSLYNSHLITMTLAAAMVAWNDTLGHWLWLFMKSVCKYCWWWRGIVTSGCIGRFCPSAQVLQLIQLRFSNIIREHCQMQNNHGWFGLHYVLSFWMGTTTWSCAVCSFGSLKSC